MKIKKYHTVRTVPKSNNKIVERAKIHDYSLSWLGTCTLINKNKKKRGRVKLVYGLKYNILCKIKYGEG